MFVHTKTNYAVSTFEDVEVGEVFTITDEDAIPDGEICMKISEVTDFNNLEYNAVNVETGELTYINGTSAVVIPMKAELEIEY